MMAVTKPRVGIGTSQLDSAGEAGHAAATAAMSHLDGSPAALVIVYASPTRYDLPTLLAAVRQVTGDAPLIGASSSGHFHQGELTEPGLGLAVLVMTAGPYRFGIASGTGMRADAFQVGQTLARQAKAALGGQPLRHGAILLLADGLAGDPQALLSGIYRITGAAVPAVGGSAADERRLRATFVFHNDQVITDGAVVVWIDSDRPLTVVSRHGWRAMGTPLLVTRVDGPVVHEIAGRPALDVVQEHFRYNDPAQDFVPDRADGYHSAHAFGVIEPDGTQLIRGAFIENDTIRTFTPLHPFSAVQVVMASPDDLLDVSESIIKDALTDEVSVLLMFGCVARIDILSARSPEEAQRLQAAAGAVPTFGFYTYGEFARTISVAGYHNATITAIAL